MDGWVTIGTKIDDSGIDKGLDNIERELNAATQATGGLSDKLQEMYDRYKELSGDGIHLESDIKEAEDLKKEMQGIVNEIEKLTGERIVIPGVTDGEAKNNVEDLGKSVKKVTKNILKWGLALLGIRGFYGMIRNSMNTILAQDSQLKADVDYIKNVMAYTLEPIIRRIIDFLKTIVTYLAYIIKAWTGRDIFAQANKSLKSANKGAKELKKTLSGFDEVNVLADTSSGGGGGASPSIQPLEEGEVPEWLRWIAENGTTVLDTLFALVGALIGVKLGLSGIQALGVGVAIFGILTTIQSIINFINDPSFENFIKVLEGIAIAAIGVGLAIGAWPVAVAGAIGLIVLLIVKHYNEIIGFFDKIENWVENNFYEPLKKLFGDKIATAIMSPIRFALGYVKGLFEGVFGGIRLIIMGIVKLFEGDFKTGITLVFAGLKSIMLAPINALISGINAVIRGLNKISFDIPDWVPVLGGKKFGFKLAEIPKLAKGGIINLPGKGVALGGAIGGERAPEGVIPLSDQQAMEQIGQAIAKYLNINATVPIYVGNRMIAKEMKRINAENDFAFNR